MEGGCEEGGVGDDGVLFVGALYFVEVVIEGLTKGVVGRCQGGLEGDEEVKEITIW